MYSLVEKKIIGAGTFLASYGQICFWMIAGENQARRLRTQYFRAIMRQDIGWFDTTSTGELTTRMVADTATIQEGISEKVCCYHRYGEMVYPI